MVYLFLADGFEEIEALCVLDFLRRAGVSVTTVGVSGNVAHGSHNIPVVCDITEDKLDTDSDFEMIILPGGMPGSKNLDESRVVDTALRAANACGAYLAAICAAPMVLGHRGYLKNKHAICFPGFEDQLDGATIADSRVVRDGNIITAAGMGVALEFGLELVSALKGKDAAEQLRRAVLAD